MKKQCNEWQRANGDAKKKDTSFTEAKRVRFARRMVRTVGGRKSLEGKKKKKGRERERRREGRKERRSERFRLARGEARAE